MRGDHEQQAGMYSYISPEQRVPTDHPLRPIRKMTDEIFKQLSPRFDQLYSRVGRPSIAPERLLRALLLQVLYSVRSERMLMEQLQYNLLFRWFVGLNLDAEVWNATTFSKNRDRLLRGEIAEEFFAAVLELAREKELLSDEHFTVDGTMVEGWASLKSFQPKDELKRNRDDKPDDPGNPTVNFHGQKRSNKTHESTTDTDLRLFKKTQGERGKAGLSGPRIDGESQRLGGECVVDLRQRHGGTRSRPADAGPTTAEETGHPGWRQRLRHERLCR